MEDREAITVSIRIIDSGVLTNILKFSAPNLLNFFGCSNSIHTFLNIEYCGIQEKMQSKTVPNQIFYKHGLWSQVLFSYLHWKRLKWRVRNDPSKLHNVTQRLYKKKNRFSRCFIFISGDFENSRSSNCAHIRFSTLVAFHPWEFFSHLTPTPWILLV